MASIRLFLTLTLIAIIILVSFLSSLRGYRESMKEAEQLFDLQLLEHAKVLGLITPTRNGSNMPLVFEALTLPVPADIDLSAEMRIAYQIFDAQQNLLLRSAIAPALQMSPFEAGYHDVNFNGYRWRALVIQEPTGHHWVMAAQRYDVRYELAESVILEAVIPTVFSIPVAAMLIWFIVGYGLRPIRLLAQEVRSREASDLSRVNLDNIPKELTPLTQSTNDLLRRLQSSFRREKRFAADAAHELRTPISILKVQIHNVLTELDNPSATMLELRQGIDAMGHLVEQILILNRTAPDQYMMNFSDVDMYLLAREVVSNEFEQFLQREQVFELDGASSWVKGDATALRSLIQNVLSNASKYTPRGGTIKMRVFSIDGRTTVQVEDSGPGIPETHLDRVFDRFYRMHGDQHYSDVSGSGLGLAIVKHIVEMHKAQITLSRARHLGGLAVTVVFQRYVKLLGQGLSDDAI